MHSQPNRGGGGGGGGGPEGGGALTDLSEDCPKDVSYSHMLY